jgi:WD40 repeat protein
MVWSLTDFSRLMVLRSKVSGSQVHLKHVLALDSHPAVLFRGMNALPVVVSVGGVRSPYDKSKFTQNPDPNIVVWDLTTGNIIRIMSITAANPTLRPITALKIFSDGSQIVTSAGDDLLFLKHKICKRQSPIGFSDFSFLI